MSDDSDIIGYAVLIMQRFENLRIDGGPMANMSIGGPPNLAGYIPVYKTLDALRAEHGEDAMYLPLRRGTKGGE